MQKSISMPGLPGIVLLTFFARVTCAEHFNIQVHDPVMIKQGDTYYAFGTGITVQFSKDLKTRNREPPPFDRNELQWPQALGIRADSQWAPDISFHNGKYYLYYAVSTFAKNTSAIGVATNPTLDSKDPNYKWEDHGMVVKSVPGRDRWNAIDPNIVVDDDGKAWLNSARSAAVSSSCG